MCGGGGSFSLSPGPHSLCTRCTTVHSCLYPNAGMLCRCVGRMHIQWTIRQQLVSAISEHVLNNFADYIPRCRGFPHNIPMVIFQHIGPSGECLALDLPGDPHSTSYCRPANSFIIQTGISLIGSRCGTPMRRGVCRHISSGIRGRGNTSRESRVGIYWI